MEAVDATFLFSPRAANSIAWKGLCWHAGAVFILREGLMAKNDRTVSRRPDGTWADKRDGAKRAAGLHDTQKDAADASKQHLLKQGGGELKIKGVDGKIRSKDTIGRPDPYPPKDTEH